MFWIKFVLIVMIVLAFVSIVKFLLRKILKIEKVKKEFYSYYHINDLHRKVDKWTRNISVITLITLLSIQLFYFENLTYLFSIGIVFFMILEYTIRAFFELKYSEHPKQAILTLTEMFLVLTAIIIVFQFQLLGSY